MSTKYNGLIASKASLVSLRYHTWRTSEHGYQCYGAGRNIRTPSRYIPDQDHCCKTLIIQVSQQSPSTAISVFSSGTKIQYDRACKAEKVLMVSNLSQVGAYISSFISPQIRATGRSHTIFVNSSSSAAAFSYSLSEERSVSATLDCS